MVKEELSWNYQTQKVFVKRKVESTVKITEFLRVSRNGRKVKTS